MTLKNVYIIAGPNGSGKTTFANKFLPKYIRCNHFINADLIANGLSPFAPQKAAIKAGRLVLEQIDDYKHRGVDFAFETTLSGKIYKKHFNELKDEGYQLTIFFLWVPNPKLSLARIKERVAEGGHNVPPQDVHRRFVRSISNFFNVYMPLIDSWMLFNNAELNPKIIAHYRDGLLNVVDNDLYLKILTESGVNNI